MKSGESHLLVTIKKQIVLTGDLHPYLNENKVFHCVTLFESNPLKWLSFVSQYLLVLLDKVFNKLLVVYNLQGRCCSLFVYRNEGLDPTLGDLWFLFVVGFNEELLEFLLEFEKGHVLIDGQGELNSFTVFFKKRPQILG